MRDHGWTAPAPWLKAALDWRDAALPGSGNPRQVPPEPPEAVREGLADEGLYDPRKRRKMPRHAAPRDRNRKAAKRWAFRIDCYLAKIVRAETQADREDRARAERVEYAFAEDRPLPPPPGRYRVIRVLQVRFAWRITRAKRRNGVHRVRPNQWSA